MDLFAPSRTMSIGANYYGLVVVDDFSRFTWTHFIATKDDAYHAFKKLAKVIRMRKRVAFLPLNQIIRQNLGMKDLINFVKNLKSNIIFQHLHSRM